MAQPPPGTHRRPQGATLLRARVVFHLLGLSSVRGVQNGLFLRGNGGATQRRLCVRRIRRCSGVDSVRVEESSRLRRGLPSVPKFPDSFFLFGSFHPPPEALCRQDHPCPYIHTHSLARIDFLLQRATKTKRPPQGHRWLSECQKKYAVGCLVW